MTGADELWAMVAVIALIEVCFLAWWVGRSRADPSHRRPRLLDDAVRLGLRARRY